MGLKKGDIIDEFKRYPDSCGLVVKVMHGGEGFQKIVCCGHELTEADVVPARLNKFGRKLSPKGVGYIIDEKKSHPNAWNAAATRSPWPTKRSCSPWGSASSGKSSLKKSRTNPLARRGPPS